MISKINNLFGGKMNYNVRLIALTKPVIDEVETPQELVAYCARVSNPANQNNKETASKLLKYLIKNSHWSPLEQVDVTVEIQCARDIGRQILRHRSFSFQEFSQRYAEAQTFTWREARTQDMKNRQNSNKIEDKELKEYWERLQEDVLTTAKSAYTSALQAGIAKEVARVLLPEGMTMSTMYMKGSLRSWIHYCSLRMGNGTQLEHKLIAEKCWELIVAEFPSLVEILQND
jgi:thymidylate synthase (FAD)